jgi:hypothetical protein
VLALFVERVDSLVGGVVGCFWMIWGEADGGTCLSIFYKGGKSQGIRGLDACRGKCFSGYDWVGGRRCILDHLSSIVYLRFG